MTEPLDLDFRVTREQGGPLVITRVSYERTRRAEPILIQLDLDVSDNPEVALHVETQCFQHGQLQGNGAWCPACGVRNSSLYSDPVKLYGITIKEGTPHQTTNGRIQGIVQLAVDCFLPLGENVEPSLRYRVMAQSLEMDQCEGSWFTLKYRGAMLLGIGRSPVNYTKD